MKKINSIYRIFMIFLVMIIASFILLYRYSSVSLRESLMSVAQIQMEHSYVLLEQKIKEIEIEADGILNSDDLKELQRIMADHYDAYAFVTGVKQMKEYLTSRQRSTVGMAEFILYWPDTERVVTTSVLSSIREEMLELAGDNTWFTYQNEVYFARKYVTDWDKYDAEPYLIIRMERDYLYKLKNMAFGMEKGGTLLTLPDGSSLFSVNEFEAALLSDATVREGEALAAEVKTERGKYQVLKSDRAKNGLGMLSYYSLREMLKPVGNISLITGISLMVLLAVGFVFLLLYYNNILLQLKILTEKLKQVEGGDFTTRITELPDNEFSYVFEQFNRMVTRIRELIESTLKEQQLRNQAELRQLQLQIHPHFLYNSLSYIVTVANKPQAVTEMAVHLANYYRYCTRKKSLATIGEEIAYAKAYLSIMAMRKNIEYNIDAAKSLYEIKIIPLILQPIIENAIEHAIEERENAKHIFVKAYRLESGAVRFEISDDGDGMTQEAIGQLTERLQKKQRDENESVGLWNVNQRLINYYDASARLKFGTSIWGGLLVFFTILPKEKKDDSTDR